MLDLDAIRKRCKAATPGPWNYDERVGCVAVYPGGKVNCMGELSDNRKLYYADGRKVADSIDWHWEVSAQELADAKFIAHAREDIPALIAELERVTGDGGTGFGGEGF